MPHELGIFINNDKLLNYRIRREHVVARNISHLLIQHVSCYCRIERGTTLRDIFSLCYPHRNFLDEMFPHCHISEYLDYGLESKRIEDFDNERNLIVIRIVENTYKNPFDVCIVGEDDENKEKLIYYSPIATDVSEIIDYEVLIRKDYLYNSEYYNDLPLDKFLETIRDVEIRVFDLIYKLFYEISWFGDPEKSNKYWENFNNLYK